MAPQLKKRKIKSTGSQRKDENIRLRPSNMNIPRQRKGKGLNFKAQVAPYLRFVIVSIIVCLLYLYVYYPVPELSQELKDWQDTGFNFNYGKFQVFYHDIFTLSPFKKKPVLLVIHGFPTSSYDWKKIIYSMKSKFGRMIAPDMLGFGFSDKPTNHNYTVSEQATIHEKLLEYLGVDDVHILAHDLGDTVAQEMLARYEDRTRNSEKGINILSLCLSNGGIFPETHQPRLIQKLLLHPWLGVILVKAANYFIFTRSFSEVFGHQTKPSWADTWEFWTLMRHKDGYLAGPRLQKYIHERVANRDRWVGGLQNTTVPLHLIYGPLDPVNPAAALELYRKLLPHSTVTILQNIGHYPQWEDPKGFLKGYYKFLDRVKL